MGLHKKRQSKRMTLAKKHSIEKKIREHRRKMRKEGTGRKKLKKDPGIPNLHPFKAEILAQMERRKVKEEEEKKRQKELRRLRVAQARSGGAPPKSMEKMMRDAQRRTDQFEAAQKAAAAAEGEDLSTNQRSFLRELKKVIEASDVIIEVLDARDPMGCRSVQIEQLIMAAGKKVVLLLNKIGAGAIGRLKTDLIPREVMNQWLTYLRGFYPTVAFKASTQAQRTHLGQAAPDVEHASDAMLKGSECVGATTLMSLLKNYCRSEGVKTGITVGIIGYPNVGKSSVINSLKRSRAVSVGSTPGVTKAMQEVHLDKLVKLLDCPGIVFNTGSGVEAVLRNAVKVEQVEDPIAPVVAIVQRCSREQLMTKYNVPRFADAQDFLYHLAASHGRLKKGGVPDIEAAARSVLRDWNEGRIAYYTVPPPTTPGVHVGASIVPAWGKELNLAELVASEQAELAALPDTARATTGFLALEASQLREEDMNLDDEDESADEDGSDDDSSDADDGSGMDTASGDDGLEASSDAGSPVDAMDDAESDDAPAPPPMRRGGPAPGRPVRRGEQLLTSTERDLNPQTNQRRRKDLKQQRKLAQKGQAKPTGAAAAAAMDESDGDAYQFGKYFAM